MKIVTLTTDMGLKDHYVASLKAYLLTSVSDVRIIDITHDVSPFNSGEAAYQVASCLRDFPAGSIHVIGVDSEPSINFGNSGGTFPSIMKYQDQIFISNDNGFFGALIMEEEHQGFYRIDDVLSNKELLKFPTKNILCKAAIELLNGKKIEEIASPQEHFARAFTPAAISETDLIKGHVIHIDNYGNLITNIHQELFDRIGKEVPFTIYFKSKNYFIDSIATTYNEVPQGEKVAIFNENGYLEIAINRAAANGTGGADKLFGLGLNDIIRIEFTPKGSRKTIESLF